MAGAIGAPAITARFALLFANDRSDRNARDNRDSRNNNDNFNRSHKSLLYTFIYDMDQYFINVTLF
jgi:hypothetical protein